MAHQDGPRPPPSKKHGHHHGAPGRDPDMAAADTLLRRVLDAHPAELHDHLRFQEPAIYNARAHILDQYRAPGGFTLGKCRDHLHFLYLTHQLRRHDDELRDMAVVASDLRLAKPHLADIYFPGPLDDDHDDPAYCPEALFRPVPGHGGAPGFPASAFVHPALLEDPPLPPEPAHPSWARWLRDSLGVRDHVRLLSRSGESLAEALLYLAEHRKDRFLGVLARAWPAQGAALAGRPALRQMIGQVSVPCAAGGLRRLWETYLPVEALRSYCAMFVQEDEPFPFLDLGGPVSAEELESRWAFLHTDLAVSAKDDVGFLLDVLGQVKEANAGGLPLARCRNLARLYHDIELKCLESASPDPVRGIVRAYIIDIKGIAIPETPDSPAHWASPQECLWDGPLQGGTKKGVRDIYATVLELPPPAMTALSGFFQDTLLVPKVG